MPPSNQRNRFASPLAIRGGLPSVPKAKLFLTETFLSSRRDTPAHMENDAVTSDAKGRFKFEVPPGDYVIGFNTFWPSSAHLLPIGLRTTHQLSTEAPQRS